jgi:hypothetical protein
MRLMLHHVLMRVIPWKCWNWRQTSFLMHINFWANQEEFIKLTEWQDRKKVQNSS